MTIPALEKHRSLLESKFAEVRSAQQGLDGTCVVRSTDRFRLRGSKTGNVKPSMPSMRLSEISMANTEPAPAAPTFGRAEVNDVRIYYRMAGTGGANQPFNVASKRPHLLWKDRPDSECPHAFRNRRLRPQKPTKQVSTLRTRRVALHSFRSMVATRSMQPSQFSVVWMISRRSPASCFPRSPSLT